jgi:hypothetical protein
MISTLTLNDMTKIVRQQGLNLWNNLAKALSSKGFRMRRTSRDFHSGLLAWHTKQEKIRLLTNMQKELRAAGINTMRDILSVEGKFISWEDLKHTEWLEDAEEHMRSYIGIYKSQSWKMEVKKRRALCSCSSIPLQDRGTVW